MEIHSGSTENITCLAFPHIFTVAHSPVIEYEITGTNKVLSRHFELGDRECHVMHQVINL